MSNLEEVIEDSLNDVVLEDADEAVVESSEVATPAGEEEVLEAPAEPEQESVEITPGGQPEAVTKPGEDEFSKRFGIPAKSVTGRENRVPHSRVKKIVEKAEREAVARVTKEFESKLGPATELSTKVQDYEQRLTKVGEFERVMENEPQKFLDMLSTLPAYKGFFEFIAQAAKNIDAGGSNQPRAGAPADSPYLDTASMPKPDFPLPDGTSVYSLEGLAKRDEWLAKQVEAKVLASAEKRLSERYAPIEQNWQQQQLINQAMPVIQKQIAEAKTWPNFDELEPEVIKLLQADANISLEGAYNRAYQKTIIPRLTTDRNKMRSELLEEIRKKPVTTAAPTGGAKPKTAPTAPKSTEDVIRAALEEAGVTLGA